MLRENRRCLKIKYYLIYFDFFNSLYYKINGNYGFIILMKPSIFILARIDLGP